MARSVCKNFSIFSLIACAVIVSLSPVAIAAESEAVSRESLRVTHYTETSWLSQYDDLVVSSKVKVDVMRLGPVQGYGGAILEQDSRSTSGTIYNDNGISPLVGATMPLWIPQLGLFTEYRQTFRVINKPDTRGGSQPDFLLGTFGYQYWNLADLSSSSNRTSFFEEAYGEIISRSKLDFNPMMESWSKTGFRWAMARGFAADAFLDIEFRRASTGEPEDNFQSLGPGLRLSYFGNKFSASLGTHQELGSYTNRSDSISRWKTLFVISGAL
jgi:hypothetical protein